MRSALLAAVSQAALLLVGCSSVVEEESPTRPLFDGAGDKTPIQYFDQGDLCLYADSYPDSFYSIGEPQIFDEYSRLAVTVAAPECLSQTCDVDRVAFCDIDMDRSTLTVTSYVAYDEIDAPMCTMDCGRLAARCKSAPLPAGNYEVVHGDTRVELRVPSIAAACHGASMGPAPTD